MAGQDEYAQKLEKAKSASTGQLLFKAARLFNERAVAKIQSLNQGQLRVAHTQLLPHIGLEGTRATDLAKKVGISKQAVGQLVDDLVEMGLLERMADPEDRRAQKIGFTEKGKQALLHGITVLSDIETELAEEVGKTKLKGLHDGLAALIGALEAEDKPAEAPKKKKPAR